MKNNGARAFESPHTVETPEDIAALREHVKQVTEGLAFKGSQRSGQFLSYIVEQWIAGRYDSLKERAIGVQLFARSVSYDTGEDAIVRVTASDVRKRLLQHYGKYGNVSPFRISLPLGSYVPEIVHDPPAPSRSLAPLPSPAPAIPDVPSSPPLGPIGPETRRPRPVFAFLSVLVVVLLAAALSALFWNRSPRNQNSAAAVLPWSQIFNSPRPVQLITSDTALTDIEAFTGKPVSLSDYANQTYIPDANHLSPDAQRLFGTIERGGKTSGVDTVIAVDIAELARPDGRKISVRGARTIQLADLETDGNLILLGSPSSNPWSALFSDQLDFRFVFDQATGQEIVQNAHPLPGEKASYIPTAMGWATGKSFATISLVQIPDQSGQALLVGGADAEGTEAAGKLVTDLPRLSAALQRCGISPTGPARHFQILLSVSTMAGSPTDAEALACHALPPASAR